MAAARRGHPNERLIEKLPEQRIFRGAPLELVRQIAAKTKLVSLLKDKRIIEQGKEQSWLYFILSGDGLSIRINNAPYRTREPGEIIGELSMVSRSNLPTASVVSAGKTSVGKISYADFKAIVVDGCPGAVGVWRELAAVASERLQQRNVHVRARGAVPRVFVASSRERIPDAERARKELVRILGRRVHVVLWTDELVFKPGSTTMLDLLQNAETYDFGLFVCGADDQLTLRELVYAATRDNVVLELGLHMGVFSDLQRAVVLMGEEKRKTRARGADRVKPKRQRIPTDLLGMTMLQYNAKRPSTIRGQMTTFAKVIKKLGPR